MAGEDAFVALAPVAATPRTITTTAVTILALGGCIVLGLTDVDVAADCADWNAEEYFREATVKDVADCLRSGANPNVRDKYSGDTPLHNAAGY